MATQTVKAACKTVSGNLSQEDANKFCDKCDRLGIGKQPVLVALCKMWIDGDISFDKANGTAYVSDACLEREMAALRKMTPDVPTSKDDEGTQVIEEPPTPAKPETETTTTVPAAIIERSKNNFVDTFMPPRDVINAALTSPTYLAVAEKLDPAERHYLGRFMDALYHKGRNDANAIKE